MGALSRIDGTKSFLWQIENNGSWRWEIGDFRDSVYISACGPTDQDHQWSKRLSAGTSFHSVPVALVLVHDNFESLFVPLTQYRRRIRRHHEDNEKLPIIFNDYMNCLMGDPTLEKVGALIQPAAKADAKYRLPQRDSETRLDRDGKEHPRYGWNVDGLDATQTSQVNIGAGFVAVLPRTSHESPAIRLSLTNAEA